MTELEFDEPTTAIHRTARFVFIPWLARFFGYGPLHGESIPLPVGDPQALTDETIVAVKEITNRAVWKFLARECGWPKIDAVVPGNAEAHSIRRLWEDHTSLPKLEFSTATPDLLLLIFNLTRTERPTAKIKWPDCTRHNGDLLVHYLAYERLRQASISSHLNSGAELDYWLQNPLNAWGGDTKYRNLNPDSIKWSILCDTGLAPFLPWIGNYFSRKWERFLCDCELVETLHRMETMTFVISDWAEQAEKFGRLDLLGMLLDFFATYHSRAETLLKTFEREMAGQPLQTRQEKALPWVDFLALVDPLEESARKCFGIHPVERTGPEKCFLARWEALRFTDTIGHLRGISGTLRPSFN